MSGLFDDTMNYLLSAADDDDALDAAFAGRYGADDATALDDTLILTPDAWQPCPRCGALMGDSVYVNRVLCASCAREIEALPFDPVSPEDKP